MSAESPFVEEAPSTLRLALTLAAAGLLSGLILVTAYQGPLPRIEANRAAALERAVFQVLPGSERMDPMVVRDGKLVAESPAAGEDAVYAGYDGSGDLVGYAVRGEGPGFQDTIALLFGWDPAKRRIVGLQILESRETPGLGDKIYKDPRWLSDFADLAAEPRVVITKGGGTAPNEIDAITGATISSKAVAAIVNGAAARWLPVLDGAGGQEGETP